MRFFPEYDYLVTPQLLLTTSAAYLVMVFSLKSLMKNRKPLYIAPLMKIYNLVQVILCACMTYGFSANFTLSNPFAINVAYTKHIEFWMIVHHLSKTLDFCDTLFMVLRKKDRQLNFLHLYHHSSIVLIWGYLLSRGDANGTAFFGAFANSFVHTVMYSHYLWTSFGFTNPFKIVVTNIQIIQFWLTLVHAVIVLVVETVLPRELAWLQMVYQSILLLLFTSFKRKTYKQKQ